ncbi:MAG: pyridoxine 5'-phosphate synthase [Candidatus Margulisbacteria bacterium]|nr:pyridoxine 5'-phosphate synthase [Candidatus Margulisiibacteriota bacterium]
MKLGVNIDHIATLREARKAEMPDVVMAAREAVLGGADGITVHLREDRRHIQDRDVWALKAEGHRLNFEMAATDEMISIAGSVLPAICCLVPEKRLEITTEGGLDVLSQMETIRNTIERLHDKNIPVSIFSDANRDQIQAAKDCGADYVELHTGVYANFTTPRQVEILQAMATFASSIGLGVNAGHGLTIENVLAICKIPEILELNIGHSIVSRAVFIGIRNAVSEMKYLLSQHV